MLGIMVSHRWIASIGFIFLIAATSDASIDYNEQLRKHFGGSMQSQESRDQMSLMVCLARGENVPTNIIHPITIRPGNDLFLICKNQFYKDISVDDMFWEQSDFTNNAKPRRVEARTGVKIVRDNGRLELHIQNIHKMNTSAFHCRAKSNDGFKDLCSRSVIVGGRLLFRK